MCCRLVTIIVTSARSSYIHTHSIHSTLVRVSVSEKQTGTTGAVFPVSTVCERKKKNSLVRNAFTSIIYLSEKELKKKRKKYDYLLHGEQWTVNTLIIFVKRNEHTGELSNLVFGWFWFDYHYWSAFFGIGGRPKHWNFSSLFVCHIFHSIHTDTHAYPTTALMWHRHWSHQFEPLELCGKWRKGRIDCAIQWKSVSI